MPASAVNSVACRQPVRQNRRLNTPHSSPLAPSRFQSFDLLATLVAVVRSNGAVLFANSALEDALGSSRRTIEGSILPESFTEPQALHRALQGAGGNQFAALRYDAWLKRLNHEPFPVHVIVTQTDVPEEIVVELLPLEQQARQEREERLVDQAQAKDRKSVV